MEHQLTDEDLEAPLDLETEAAIDAAIQNAGDSDDENVAISVSFDIRNRMLMLQLKTGQRLAIPQEDLQEIYDAQPPEVAQVELVGSGTALHWERLGEGMLVQYLRQGFYGNQRWMSSLAQRRRELLKAG